LQKAEKEAPATRREDDEAGRSFFEKGARRARPNFL